MIVQPTPKQYNLFLNFCLYLNKINGMTEDNSANYYNFIDNNRVSEADMYKTIQICNPFFRNKKYPYIYIRPKKETGTGHEEFYLTTTGNNWVKGRSRYSFPNFMSEPQEEKREDIIKSTKPKVSLPPIKPNKYGLPPIKSAKVDSRWSKQEVINLMTSEAHVVGRMLGTGYDLLEPIHSDWVRNWITNPYNHRITVHQAHRNSYKCENPETLIMMADCTSKKIKDVQIGEYVMGWDSTPRKVINKHSGYDEMYRVTLNKNGEYYECNGEHILTLKQTPFARDKFHCVDKYRDKENPMIIDIPLKEFLKSPAYLRKKGKNESYFKHFKVGLKNIKKQKVEIPPYILGCWLGDGHSDRTAITTMDSEIRDEFWKWCNQLGLKEIVHKKNNNKASTYHYAVLNSNKERNPFKELLKKYNLLKNKHIPLEYLNNDETTRYELLAGLLDTDGCYGKAGHYTYTTILEDLAKQVEWLARSLGLNATAKQINTFYIKNGVKKESNAWQVYINGNNLYKIPVRLKRKKAIRKNRSDNRCTSFSQKIEAIGKGEFVGIEIEGDGRYLHNDFTVVHNSTALRLFIAEEMILNPFLTIILLRKSEDAVKELINGVSKILDSPLFATFANILYPDIAFKGGFKKPTDTALSIDTNLNTSLSGEFQLRGLGLGSPLTGKHGKLIITDDICSLEDRESESERKNTIAKYQELMNVLSNDKASVDARILNIGTPWHEEDVFKLMDKGLKPKDESYEKIEKLMNETKDKDKKEKYKEILRQADMKRGKFVYNCYQTGLMTEKDIEWKKQVLNDDVLFAANYLLTLVSDDEKPFPRINNVGNYTKEFFQDCWQVVGHIDCAYGGDDSTSLSIGGYDYDNFNTVVYGKRWDKIPIDQNYLEVAEILWNCGCNILYLEKNADKGLMGDKFRELGFDVRSYHESQNKHTKIVSTIRPFWREEGNEVLPCVQFVAETDEAYLSQIYDYKKGVRHDDCPDNLASLLIHSRFGELAVRIT